MASVASEWQRVQVLADHTMIANESKGHTEVKTQVTDNAVQAQMADVKRVQVVNVSFLCR